LASFREPRQTNRIAEAAEMTDASVQQTADGIEAATTRQQTMEEMKPTVAAGSVPTEGAEPVQSKAAAAPDEEGKKQEEQNEEKLAKNLAPAVTAAEDVNQLASALQEVDESITDYEETTRTETRGATEGDSSITPAKYKVGDIVEYKFGAGIMDWVDAQVQRVHDSGTMVLTYRDATHKDVTMVLSQPLWETRVIRKLLTPSQMIDKLAAWLNSPYTSGSKFERQDYRAWEAGKFIATQFAVAVTRNFTRWVDCTPSTNITKYQWADYWRKGIDSKEVQDIFRGAEVMTFLQFAEHMVETYPKR